jgi:hypothetical protein
MKPAYLFHNSGKGTFVEKAIASGCGLGGNGNTMAGMGVVAGDLDGSQRLSLFVTNFQHEPNVLFRNRGGLRFVDESHPSGLGLPSLPRLGFGAVLLDANRDGRSDLAVVNGHVNRHAKQIGSANFAQESQLFLGEGQGKYREVSQQAGPFFHQRHVGRGLAVADYNRDGLPDLAISNNGGPAILLRNDTENAHHGIGLRLEGDGVKSNRDAIGSRVEVITEAGTQVFAICGGGSYLSCSDRQILAGVGNATEVSRVTVRWPSGRVQEFRSLLAGRTYQLVEGKDEAIPLHSATPTR